jgi:hypothetical protein
MRSSQHHGVSGTQWAGYIGNWIAHCVQKCIVPQVFSLSWRQHGCGGILSAIAEIKLNLHIWILENTDLQSIASITPLVALSTCGQSFHWTQRNVNVTVAGRIRMMTEAHSIIPRVQRNGPIHNCLLPTVITSHRSRFVGQRISPASVCNLTNSTSSDYYV